MMTFVFIAALLWLIIKLSTNYTVTEPLNITFESLCVCILLIENTDDFFQHLTLPFSFDFLVWESCETIAEITMNLEKFPSGATGNVLEILI